MEITYFTVNRRHGSGDLLGVYFVAVNRRRRSGDLLGVYYSTGRTSMTSGM